MAKATFPPDKVFRFDPWKLAMIDQVNVILGEYPKGPNGHNYDEDWSDEEDRDDEDDDRDDEDDD